MGTSYTAPAITSTGLSIAPYSAILSLLLQQFRAIYGAAAYLQPSVADYQDIAVRALQAADVNSALQQVYLAFNPLTAIGPSLDLIGKLIGTARNQSTFSTALLTVTGTAGTVINSGLVQDINGNFWALPGLVTIGSGGTISVTATAQVAGVITANPGTITTISTPTAGWVAVTNAAAASPGEAVEPDSQYRARLLISQAKPSLSLPAGTEAAIAAVTGVTRSVVYENYFGYTAGYGFVSTAGTAVKLLIGYPFDSSVATQAITINGISYTIASVTDANDLVLSTPAVGVATTATTTSTNPVIVVTSATGIVFGQTCVGAGIPVNTTVTIVSGTSITLSNNATASATVAVQFFTPQANVPYNIGGGILLGPAHSITAVVENGAPANIAQAIYTNKNPGVLTNGTTTVTVIDPSNGDISLPIAFDILGYVQIYVSLNVHALNGYTSATTNAIQQAVLTYLDSLGIGESVVFSQLYVAAGSVQTNPLQPTFSIYAILSGYAAAITTATTIASNAVITVTSATGIADGQTAVGAGIPANTTVTNVSGTSITLSNEATAGASGVPVTFFSTGVVDISLPYNQAPNSSLAQVVINSV